MSVFGNMMTREHLLGEIKELTGQSVHPRTIRRWEVDYGLPVIRRGRHRLYDRAQVEAWLRGERIRQGKRKQP